MEKKIVMGIPTYKNVSALAFVHLMRSLLDGINCGLVKNLTLEADMYVTMARNKMCASALELQAQAGITHLLMVDDDMLVPDGAIAKLASNDVPVVGGAYFTRDLKPVAYKFDPFVFLDDIPSSGVIPVEGTGGGFLLIACDVLKQMRERYRDDWWFQNTIERDGGIDKYLGEDVFFFRRLKEMGIPVYLDCDAWCGHAGMSVIDRATFDLSKRLDAERLEARSKSNQI